MREASEEGKNQICARWVDGISSDNPPSSFFSQKVSSGPKKISVKFHGVWTPFDIDFLQCINKYKTATSTRHWVNRLVPRNDIKLL